MDCVYIAHLLDELVGHGHTRGPLDTLETHIEALVAVDDVLVDGAREDDGLLGHVADVPLDPREGLVADGLAVDEDVTLGGRDESRNQVEHGGLACSAIH